MLQLSFLMNAAYLAYLITLSITLTMKSLRVIANWVVTCANLNMIVKRTHAQTAADCER